MCRPPALFIDRFASMEQHVRAFHAAHHHVGERVAVDVAY
jgi:hypothetical protein